MWQAPRYPHSYANGTLWSLLEGVPPDRKALTTGRAGPNAHRAVSDVWVSQRVENAVVERIQSEPQHENAAVFCMEFVRQPFLKPVINYTNSTDTNKE